MPLAAGEQWPYVLGQLARAPFLQFYIHSHFQQLVVFIIQNQYLD